MSAEMDAPGTCRSSLDHGLAIFSFFMKKSYLWLAHAQETVDRQEAGLAGHDRARGARSTSFMNLY